MRLAESQARLSGTPDCAVILPTKINVIGWDGKSFKRQKTYSFYAQSETMPASGPLREVDPDDPEWERDSDKTCLSLDWLKEIRKDGSLTAVIALRYDDESEKQGKRGVAILRFSREYSSYTFEGWVSPLKER